LRLVEAGVVLTVAHVLEKLSEGKEDAEQTKEAIAGLLKDFCKIIEAPCLVRAGDPVKVLPQLADEIAADAIVIGVKRQSAAMGLFFGSRADALIRISPAPILSAALVMAGDRL
jgi:nucleotide-binding universal stress UspA family protein